MRYIAYRVRYSAVPINSSPLTVTLFSSVVTTLVYNDTQYFMIIWPNSSIRMFDSIY